MEVADRPGVLAQVAEVLGMQGCSIKSSYQHGPGRRRAAGHDRAPDARVAPVRGAALIGRLDFMRAEPHAIRVIEEEFVVSPA